MASTPVVQSPYLIDQSTTRDYLHFLDFEPALRSIIQGAQTPLTVGQFGCLWGRGTGRPSGWTEEKCSLIP